MNPNKSRQPRFGESLGMSFVILLVTSFGLAIGIGFIANDYEHPYGIVAAALGVSIPAFIGCFLCGLIVMRRDTPAYIMSALVVVMRRDTPAYIMSALVVVMCYSAMSNPVKNDTYITAALLSGILSSFLGTYLGSVVKEKRLQK